MADSQTDFRRANPNDGWSYGYYFRTSAVRSLYLNNQWSESIPGYIYASSYARITASTLHPNSGSDCVTPSFGLIKPSIAWQKLEAEERGYYRVEYNASHSHTCGDGVVLTLLIDGQQVAYDTNPIGTISRNDIFIREAIQSLELILDPRAGCSCDETSFRIQIYGAQISASPSPSPSESASPSLSPSITPTVTSSETSSPSIRPTSTITATVSSSSSITLTATMTPTITLNYTPPKTPSNSRSITPTKSITLSSTPTISQSESVGFWDQEPSLTPTTSPSMSASSSISGSSSLSPISSPSKSGSYSGNPSMFYSTMPFNFTQTPTHSGQAEAVLQNLTSALTGPVSPERFDNLLSGLGSAQSSISESQAFSFLTNLVAALGTENLDPTRGEAIIGLLGNLQPSAETLASNSALLQNLAQGLTNSLPVGQSLVLGNPASGFALAVIKVDPTAEANLALGENSTLTIPPLASALGGLSAPLHFAASGTDNPTYSIGLSLNGTEITISNLSEPFVMGFPSPATPPNANQTIQCEYYDPTTRRWLADGCETKYDNITYQTQCSCNHLTEFAARFKALADVQAGVGQGFVDLFTKALSGKVIPILVFLLVMAATTFILLFILNNLDKKAIGSYSKMLELLPQLREIRKTVGLADDDVWDRFLTKAFFSLPRGANERKVLRERALPRGGTIKKILEFWWRRLFHQHFYTSLLVRYDPATPRVLRALFAMTGFFTSVAIVIFFYGYQNGSVGGEQLPPITLVETLVLSLMSSALTTPIVTALRILMTRAGRWEYVVRYPELMAEIGRRRMFENTLAQLSPDEIIKQGLPILEKLQAISSTDNISSGSDSGSDSGKSQTKRIRSSNKPRPVGIVIKGTATESGQEVAAAAASVFTALDEGGANGDSTAGALEVNFAFQVIRWLASNCLCGRKSSKKESPSLQRIIRQFAKQIPSKEAVKEPCLPYRFFPVHTGKTWLMVFSMFGWTAFTMIYILAFTSYESSDVAADVIKTVAISQAISNAVVAPITQLSSIVIPYFLTIIKHAFKKPVPIPTFGSPLVASLDNALSVRLPALASKHPCCSGDKKVDVTLLPVSEIVNFLSNTPLPEINTRAMEIVRDLYINLFYKKKKTKIVVPDEIKIDGSSFSEERAYKNL